MFSNFLSGAVCLSMASLATECEALTLNSYSRSDFDQTTSSFEITTDDFDNEAAGDTPSTDGVEYDASQGDVIITDGFLSSSSPNSLGSTSFGFFAPSETVELTFGLPQTALGIDVNTFAKETGAYTAKFNNGDEVNSRFAPFDSTATGQFLGYIGSSFTSVIIEAASGLSFNLDTLKFGNSNGQQGSGSSNTDPASQGASFITAFRNYVEGSANTEKTYLERLDECASQARCDFEATINDEEFQQNLSNAREATFASKDLVTRTSLLPQNKLELAADAPSIMTEIKALFQWIGLLPEEENRDDLINVSVEGDSGEFTVNPTFESYALTYVFDFNGPSFFEDLVGESFLFNQSIGGGKFFAGYGTVEFADAFDFSGNSRAIVSISQIESSDAAIFSEIAPVPLPAGLYLLVSGLIILLVKGGRKTMLKTLNTLPTMSSNT